MTKVQDLTKIQNVPILQLRSGFSTERTFFVLQSIKVRSGFSTERNFQDFRLSTTFWFQYRTFLSQKCMFLFLYEPRKSIKLLITIKQLRFQIFNYVLVLVQMSKFLWYQRNTFAKLISRKISQVRVQLIFCTFATFALLSLEVQQFSYHSNFIRDQFWPILEGQI